MHDAPYLQLPTPTFDYFYVTLALYKKFQLILFSQEFGKAKLPVCFFIRLFVRATVEWHDSSMENGETKEKLVVKKVTTSEPINHQQMVLISRYPLTASKRWIEANEREAIDWNFDKQNGRICLLNQFKNAI
jgi:hypothetical protein